MSIPLENALHNVTQEAEVLNILHDFTTTTNVPAALLEGFLFGTCPPKEVVVFQRCLGSTILTSLIGASTAGILVGSYMLWLVLYAYTLGNRTNDTDGHFRVSSRHQVHASRKARVTLLLWSLYILFVTHWILTLRQLLQLLSGRYGLETLLSPALL